MLIVATKAILTMQIKMKQIALLSYCNYRTWSTSDSVTEGLLNKSNVSRVGRASRNNRTFTGAKCHCDCKSTLAGRAEDSRPYDASHFSSRRSLADDLRATLV